MANDANGMIKKIKLSDGSIYSIFDNGALRLDPTTNKLITGNGVVDALLLDGDLYIQEIDDQDVTKDWSVVTWDHTSHKITQRSSDTILEDIGGISYSMDASNGILAFKFGKQ